MDSALCVCGICKAFREKGETIQALDHVSVRFPQGTICGLLGNNGAGKTTLIKCISGLLLPEEGQVLLGDTELLGNAALRRKKISVVLDGGRNLFWYMTVKENLRYFLMLKGQPYDAKLTQPLLAQLGLEDLADKQLQQLSFGMRQRASIAVALASHAEIIIMDEPTNGLDIQYKDELVRLVKAMREQYQCTFIISSHDMAFVEALCEYCVLIDKGKILHAGSLASFHSAFRSSEYAIRYRCEGAVKLDALPLRTTEHNAEERTFHVLWPQDRPVNNMLHTLAECGLSVMEIGRADGLAAAITMMTHRDEAEDEL